MHVAADDGAVEDIMGGEQRGRAAAFVVVGHGAAGQPQTFERFPANKGLEEEPA
jgi:hypothetical protein